MLAVPQPKLPVPNDLLPKPFPPASRFPSSPLLRLRPLLYLVSADSLLPGWSCLLRFSGSSLLLHQQLLQRPLQRQQQKQQQHPHFSFLSTAASASFISSSSSSSSSFGSSKKSGVGKLLESQVPPPPPQPPFLGPQLAFLSPAWGVRGRCSAKQLLIIPYLQEESAGGVPCLSVYYIFFGRIPEE